MPATPNSSGLTQRQIYKLVDKLLSGHFKDELELLRALITDIVERKEIPITGGRLWQLVPDRDAYELKFQYGDIATIPNGYQIEIKEQPIFAKLAAQRTVTNYETDTVLLEKGIRLYSATGVGELIKRQEGKYYQYALAFNAPEVNQEFFDTLNIIGSAATAALRDMDIQIRQERLQRDLDRASEIQHGLLPDHHLNFAEYDIFGVSLPDSVVGGDYFDYLQPSEDEEDRVGIIISDAASKGLPAAIQALFVSGAIRMGVSFNTKISSLISRMNALIYDTFPYERFVTLFYCELMSSRSGLVLYANAGHCAPIHYSARKDQFEMLGPTGGILGIVPQQKFRIENINMRHGDILVLYTDGISEAQDRNAIQFGTERIQELIHEHKDSDARTIAYALLEAVQHYTVGSHYSDDKTIVVIKRDKNKSSELLIEKAKEIIGEEAGVN